MRPLVLILGCLVLPAQTFTYMDCCCGDFCTHKNACTGCQDDETKPCEMHPGHHPGGDCCPSRAPSPAPVKEHRHQKACAHVSPSSEVNVQVAEPVAQPPMMVEFVAIVPLIPGPVFQGVRDYLVEPVPRPEGSLARHLFLSVLQV